MFELAIILLAVIAGIVMIATANDKKSENLLLHKVKAKNKLKLQFEAAETDEEKQMVIKKFTRKTRFGGASMIVFGLLLILKTITDMAILTGK